MLNTYYHSKEDVEKAYSMLPDDVDKESYASLLIFCNFNKELANEYYKKLIDKGFLTMREVLGFGSEELGWSLPYEKTKGFKNV